jgi:dTDP-4-amino-4,6-dideoxygalactose transaminase
MYFIGKEEKEALCRVIDAQLLIRYAGDNPKHLRMVETFEKEFARAMGAKYALGVTSGTAALICCLIGCGVGPGDEVIVPGYTFIASATAVVQCKAIPVIAEIDESLNIDPKDVEKKITRHTKAIMPVHMLGLPSNMDAITKIARKHKLMVVEDCCQADGGRYRGRRLGTWGHMGGYSLNYYKIITTGEGGALVTSDYERYQRAAIYHDQGLPYRGLTQTIPYFAGSNFRMNEFLGALALTQLHRMDGFIRPMNKFKRQITRAIEDIKGVKASPVNDPEGDCGTTMCLIAPDVETAKRFSAALSRNGVGNGSPINSGRHVYRHWEYILSKSSASKDGCPWTCPHYKGKVEYSVDMCPKTLDILARTVTFGLSPFWKPADVKKRIEAIKAAAKEIA